MAEELTLKEGKLNPSIVRKEKLRKMKEKFGVK